MRVGLMTNGEGIALERIVALGVAAESAGFESFWHAENQRDPWVPLSVVASRTTTLRIGTALAIWARSPLLAEMIAGNLDELSRGRFVLGLGTAPKSFNEDWHGIPYVRPVDRMREYVAVVRAGLRAHSGRTATFDGDFFSVRGYPRQVPPFREDLPIYLGAVSRRMCGLAGEVADGVVFNVLTTPRYLTEYALGFVGEGLARAGRERRDVELGSVVLTAVSADGAEARRLARHQIAYYAQIPYFDVMLDLHGFQREAATLRAAAAAGDERGMIAAVTDEMVRALSVAGTPDECRAQLGEFAGALDLALLFSPAFRLGADEIEANHAAILETFGG